MANTVGPYGGNENLRQGDPRAAAGPRMCRRVACAFALALAALPPVAGATEPAAKGPMSDLPNAREIARQLFSHRPGRTEVRIVAGWVPAEMRKGLEIAGKTQPYYGVFAASPDRGLYDESATAAVNYHDLDHAAAVALGSCNTKLKRGERRCEIVAEIVPRGYGTKKKPAITLSMGATKAFRSQFRRGKKHRAFAISPRTGAWGIATGAETAERAIEEAIGACKRHAAEKAPSRDAGADCRPIALD